MKCKNCGREISPDAVFCDFCGCKIELASDRLYCGNCGAEITDGSAFCGNCGAPVADNTAGQQVADEHKNKGGANKNVILVATIILLVALIVGLITGFSLYAGAGRQKDLQNNISTSKPVVQTEDPASENSEETDNAPATEAPLATVTPTENMVPAVGSQSMSNNGYYTYVNSKYGFSCQYPSWFEVSQYDEEMLSCNSPDGEIELDSFCYESNGISPSTALADYIASCGGVVDYQSSGKNSYAVRIAYPKIYRYTYAHYKNGMVFVFMVDFTIPRFNESDAMINYIYNSFSAQFK